MKVYDIKNARKNTDSCVFINIIYKTSDIIHKNAKKKNNSENVHLLKVKGNTCIFAKGRINI